MPASDDELLRRLRATFKLEAHAHLQTMASGLVALEGAASGVQGDTLDVVFRAAHSLKGAARAVNAGTVESLCQVIESVFSALRRRSVRATAGLYDLLHRGLDVLTGLVATLDTAPTPEQQHRVAQVRFDLYSALAQPAPGESRPGVRPGAVGAAEAPPAPGLQGGAPQVQEARPSEAAPAVTPRPPVLPGSVRIRTHTLDAVLLQSEELLFAKNASAQRAAGLRLIRQQPAAWKKRWSALRDDLRCVERAVAGGAFASPAERAAWDRLRDHLEASEDFVTALESDLLRQSRAAEQEERTIGQMVDQLLEEMKQVAVQPFSSLLDLFPVSVRELARDLGKEVDLVVSGAELEIDRRILDEIKDPLIHLVRNSIDHGIEAAPIRRARGKRPRGTLAIEVSAMQGRQVSIVVRDDGAGFDPSALNVAALKAGVRSPGDGAATASGQESAAPAAAMTGEEMLALACETGVSTSALITDISGRGLGLAIVKQQVERLTGSLTLSSEPGRGTAFSLVLPLTLARFRGVVLRLGRQWFVVPTRNVARVARIRAEEVRTVEGRETLTLDGRVLAVAHLARVLGVADDESADTAADVHLPLVVLNGSLQPIAFRVDEVIDEREVLVKPLGAQLESLRHVAGATVLGNGRVVPILHVPDLLASAASGAGEGAVRRPAAPAERKSVLVADDSITSRSLLKGILETAGYRVETAADGVDAFTALRSSPFDLLVSDVDMPRLNGFGLTARIRADKKLGDLPVVLVTALESREDREQGIDVGASAYIVKSSFDQSNLLDVVQRLL